MPSKQLSLLPAEPGAATSAPAPLPMASGAILSADGLYRYSLTRGWGPGATMCFVMLNPSTADATEDDATIRRCIGFARRDDYDAIEVVNLFAWRATDPRQLDVPSDPVGEGNDEALQRAADRAGIIVAAWGGKLPARHNGRDAEVLRLLARTGRAVYCLGHTKTGAPRHPLYLPAGAALHLFQAAQEAR